MILAYYQVLAVVNAEVDHKEPLDKREQAEVDMTPKEPVQVANLELYPTISLKQQLG